MAALSTATMDSFVDESIKDNIKILPDLYDALKKERNELRRQLSGVSHKESGGSDEDDWEQVASDTRQAISQLQTLSKDFMMLQQREKDSKEKKREDEEQEKKPEDLSSKEMETISSTILPSIRELDEFERLQKYLSWVKRTQFLSKTISSQLSRGDIDVAMDTFHKLSNMVDKLSPSSCAHLKDFVTSNCEHWRTQLKEALSHKFTELLKMICWPLTKETSTKALEVWKQKQYDFSLCFKHLMSIDKNRCQYSKTHIPNLEDPILLPIELLLDPIRKRFRFHFYGNRKTNSREKPEWYFTQVSNWITDHATFLETHVQSVLNQTEYQYVDVKMEFIRGLLQELMKKLRHELNPSNHPNNKCTIDDDYLLSHLIDELLLFDKEIRTIHSYSPLYPACIMVLLDERILCRWLNLEKQFAAEKLKRITESPTAWQPQYVLDEDDSCVPECAEKFMQLITGITERYKQIPVLFLRLQFLELQTDLLLEFHQDLTQAVDGMSATPISKRYMAYLNAANYISSLLKVWGEETFFLELHYYAQHLNTDRFNDQEQAFEQVEALRKIDPEFAKLEGTAFNSVTTVFESLCESMIDVVIGQFINSVQSMCNGYKREKWHNISTVSDPALLELSSTALNFIVKIQELLHTLKSTISSLLHDEMFDRLGNELDNFLLNQIIYPNHFSIGGADQLHHDITKVFKPLVNDCLRDAYPSSNLLRKSCNASLLLQMQQGSIDLLQGLLQLAIKGDETAYQEAMSVLSDMKIIYPNHFSIGGADQLHRDITKVFKPLVNDCLRDTYPSSNLLRKSCNASLLLQMQQGSIDLLQGLLQLAIKGDETAYQEAMSVLRDMKVTNLTLEEALKITSLRIYHFE